MLVNFKIQRLSHSWSVLSVKCTGRKNVTGCSFIKFRQSRLLHHVHMLCLNIPKRQTLITKPLFYAIATNELCFLFFWQLQPPTQRPKGHNKHKSNRHTIVEMEMINTTSTTISTKSTATQSWKWTYYETPDSQKLGPCKVQQYKSYSNFFFLTQTLYLQMHATSKWRCHYPIYNAVI